MGKVKRQRRRRGSDIVTAERLTSYELLRRHLVVGSWFGHLLFLLYGVIYGAAYGIVGGIRFFADMFWLDQLGSLNTFIGMVFGAFIGLVCVWTICVLLGSFAGALVYWYKFRSFPMP